MTPAQTLLGAYSIWKLFISSLDKWWNITLGREPITLINSNWMFVFECNKSNEDISSNKYFQCLQALIENLVVQIRRLFNRRDKITIIRWKQIPHILECIKYIKTMRVILVFCITQKLSLHTLGAFYQRLYNN